jgi:hypothetical protein
MVPPLSKLGPARKIGIVKIPRPKAMPRPQGTSEIELALVRLVGVSKMICLLDVAALSHGVHAMGLSMTHVEHAARVLAFDNLGDDSLPDVCETISPKRVGGKRASPLPLTSSVFLCFNFALSSRALMVVL